MRNSEFEIEEDFDSAQAFFAVPYSNSSHIRKKDSRTQCAKRFK